MENRERERSIGGLWNKQSSKGNKYVWGKIEVNGQTQEFVAFKNLKKNPGEKTPDWRLFASVKSGTKSNSQKQEVKKEEEAVL